MEQFAGYGFNKSHSAAYAYLAYVTAYLKAHYSVEFMSALLTSEAGNTDKIVKYINECREMGIRVLPPDVNQSDLHLHAGGRRDPFRAWARSRMSARARWRRLWPRARRVVDSSSIYNFCERVNLGTVNRRVMESLIKAGAMDSLKGNRAQLTEPSIARWKPDCGLRDRAMGQPAYSVLRRAQRAGISSGEPAGLDYGAKACW